MKKKKKHLEKQISELVGRAVSLTVGSISFITAGLGLIFRVAMSLLQYHKDCYGVGAVSKQKAVKGKT